MGGSIAVSVANGGPPGKLLYLDFFNVPDDYLGVLYEFLLACAWYGFLGASIAEVRLHHSLQQALCM
jgi:hypothetical protein